MATMLPGRRLVIDTSMGRDRAMETSRAKIITLTPEPTAAPTMGTRSSPSPK
jgi:hypothetical protein